MKLHEALRDALGYLELCEADPNIRINMGWWFVWNDNYFRDYCTVCLAGAYFCEGVFERSLDPKMMWRPGNKPLYGALDMLRCGRVTEAIRHFGTRYPTEQKWVTVCDYEKNPTQFKQDMREILEYLEAENY